MSQIHLQNWQILPCVNSKRFPPVWVCCVGENNGKLIKTGYIEEVTGLLTFKDKNDKYSLQKLHHKHRNNDPLKWNHLPSDFERQITKYLAEELKYDTLATQLVQSYYCNLLDTEC
eukprot:NODE_818_length_3941_cov_0.458355.p3 type:complete len:116 gc:universal NODE_818_length_3941_cov_0.458355:3637-3290(-)